MGKIDEPALLNLVECLYEAAADPARWPDFMGVCGRAMDESGGLTAEFSALLTGLGGACIGKQTDVRRLLMPHVQRAMSMRQRLEATHLPGRAALASLDLLPTAVWLLGAGGELLHSNPVAKRITQCGDVLALDSNGKLHACVAMEDRHLQQLIGGVLHAGSRPATEAGMTFMMLGNNGSGMLHMMAAPLACGSNGCGEMAALYATCLNSQPSDLEQNLRHFYALTPMEARLAAALVAGESVQEFAGQARIAEATARTHMKHILAKTGARRQANLVRIIVTGPAMLCCPAGRD